MDEEQIKSGRWISTEAGLIPTEDAIRAYQEYDNLREEIKKLKSERGYSYSDLITAWNAARFKGIMQYGERVISGAHCTFREWFEAWDSLPELPKDA